MILLFPRLPRAPATLLAKQRAVMSIDDLRELSSASHPAAHYAPTGGVRIQEETLVALASAVRDLARACGYPNARSIGADDQIDGKLGKLLHEDAGLSASEACRDEVWNFLGCVLLPDYVRWRFPGEATSTKNFLGSDRGIDNALGRSWWAAELLRDDDSPDDPYDLLIGLGVDETVGFSRRSRAVVNRRVALMMAHTVIAVHEAGIPFARLDLMRDAMKRFLRLASIVSFESLTTAELSRSMWDIVITSARHMAAAKGHDFSPPEPGEFLLADVPAPAPARLPVSVDRIDGDEAAKPVDDLTAILADIEIDSKSPHRFGPVKTWLGMLLQIDPEDVSVKRLTDAKNYRNRIGESLRQHPKLALLLSSGDTDKVVEAAVSRMHLSSRSTMLVCDPAEDTASWTVTNIIALPTSTVKSDAVRAFPDAKCIYVEFLPAATPDISTDVLFRLTRELEKLPLGSPDALAEVESVAQRIAGIEPRSKRIIDAKNVGNRISEGLGVDTSLLVLDVADKLHDSAVDKAWELIHTLDKPCPVLVVTTDDDGCLTRTPILLYDSPGDDDADDELEGSSVDEEPADAELEHEPEAESTSSNSFLELDTVEEQADLVAQYLLFLGPMDKHDAIRLVAEGLRDAGHLDYQRLRTNGRVYSAILAAIEMGVRTGCLDRPQRGQIRATLTSPDDFSPDDWIHAVKQALDTQELVARDDLVRVVASWARDNLGLEYSRIRRNGKIDSGVRNAVRTLIRRGEMNAVTRDGVVLLDDE